MTAAPLFTGRVLKGGLLVMDRPGEYAKYVRSFHGRFVEVIVRKQRVQRSLDQNAYLHVAAFIPLAEHLGYTLAEMKLLLMGACWGWQTVGGHELPVKIHTADMTVEEATHFIDWIIPFALEHFDFIIPLPSEVAA